MKFIQNALNGAENTHTIFKINYLSYTKCEHSQCEKYPKFFTLRIAVFHALFRCNFGIKRSAPRLKPPRAIKAVLKCPISPKSPIIVGVAPAPMAEAKGIIKEKATFLVLAVVILDMVVLKTGKKAATMAG